MSLRDRKRVRTRQAIVDAATELFEQRGYDGTAVAEIAAAAEIGTRTFFSYFASKEEVLFPESDDRVRAAVEAIADRKPGEKPAAVLLRALRRVGEDGDDMGSRTAALRVRFIRTVPAVRGRAAQIQFDAQREIARHLAAAYPEELTEIQAGALTGAFMGAVTGALAVILEDLSEEDDPQAVQAAVREATDLALAVYLQP